MDYAKNPAATVRVRYMVSDVATATEFYKTKLGFRVDLTSGPYFAALSRNGLQLLLSPVKAGRSLTARCRTANAPRQAAGPGSC